LPGPVGARAAASIAALDTTLRRRLGLLLVLALLVSPGAQEALASARAATADADAHAEPAAQRGAPSSSSEDGLGFEPAPLEPGAAARLDEGRRNPAPSPGARLHPAERSLRLRVAPCEPPAETTAAGPLARWCLAHSTGTASP